MRQPGGVPRGTAAADSITPAAACGALVGLVEADRGLLARLPSPPVETLVVVLLAMGVYAAATVTIVLLLNSVRGRPRRPFAVGVGVAIAVAVAAVRLRSLIGFAQLELLAFALAPLLEGALAGTVASWLVGRSRERALRRLFLLLVGIALVAAIAAGGRAPLRERSRGSGSDSTHSNLLLVSVDTLRADHLGAYGSSQRLTPALDTLAAEGVTFLHAVSPIAVTGPSHTTMLTGLAPSRHGAVRNGVPLSSRVPTVVDALGGAGYRTGGFVSGWTLSHAAAGLGDRFTHWDEDFSLRPWWPAAATAVPLLWLVDRSWEVIVPRLGLRAIEVTQSGGRTERPGAHTVDRALAWIEKSGGQPFFAFVHLFEPHRPYAPSLSRLRELPPSSLGLDRLEMVEPDLRKLVANPAAVDRIRQLYAAEIREADALVGRLLDGIARLGLARPTIVVFTADHGEGLGEHGEYFDHADFVYEVTAHVPLIVRRPDDRLAGRRIDALVRLADIAPTLLELAGLSPQSDLDGWSLLPHLDGKPTFDATGPTLGFASSDTDGFHRSVRHSVRTRRYKLIWTVDERGLIDGGPAFEELFDLESDPHELRNLLPTETTLEIVAQLREALRAAIQEKRTAVPAIDPEAAERLRSLGYL